MNANEQLVKAVEKLSLDFSIVLGIIEDNNLDAEDILCDKYPFQLSFDEQYFSILEWLNAMRDKVKD